MQGPDDHDFEMVDLAVDQERLQRLERENQEMEDMRVAMELAGQAHCPAPSPPQPPAPPRQQQQQQPPEQDEESMLREALALSEAQYRQEEERRQMAGPASPTGDAGPQGAAAQQQQAACVTAPAASADTGAVQLAPAVRGVTLTRSSPEDLVGAGWVNDPLRLAEITPGGLGERAGLCAYAGQRLVAVSGIPVTNATEVTAVMAGRTQITLEFAAPGEQLDPSPSPAAGDVPHPGAEREQGGGGQADIDGDMAMALQLSQEPQSPASALTDDFHAAAAAARTDLSRLNHSEQLQLYGLYKQATVGDIDIHKPGLLDMKGRGKHDAWSRHKGTCRQAAQREYIELVRSLSAVSRQRRAAAPVVPQPEEPPAPVDPVPPPRSPSQPLSEPPQMEDGEEAAVSAARLAEEEHRAAAEAACSREREALAAALAAVADFWGLEVPVEPSAQALTGELSAAQAQAEPPLGPRVCIIGAPGCGKSWLLHALAGEVVVPRRWRGKAEVRNAPSPAVTVVDPAGHRMGPVPFDAHDNPVARSAAVLAAISAALPQPASASDPAMANWTLLLDYPLLDLPEGLRLSEVRCKPAELPAVVGTCPAGAVALVVLNGLSETERMAAAAASRERGLAAVTVNAKADAERLEADYTLSARKSVSARVLLRCASSALSTSCGVSTASLMSTAQLQPMQPCDYVDDHSKLCAVLSDRVFTVIASARAQWAAAAKEKVLAAARGLGELAAAREQQWAAVRARAALIAAAAAPTG